MDNQVRLQLLAPAYHLGHFLRRLALPPRHQALVADAPREKLAVGLENDRHEPDIALGIAGDDGTRRFVLGTVDIAK
ncbi:MAG: hypothetical protein NTV86_12810 [Planctomycetota bacterium]|nr:hypothetical protein [Planctomycetota bacterium]